jgi:hypothetical protein
MTETPRLAAGKQWIEAVFEQIRGPYRDTVRIVSWEWLDEDPEYGLRLQLTGQETPAYIPSRGLGFGQGQLVACGIPDPAHDAARAEVEATIHIRMAALAATAPSPA